MANPILSTDNVILNVDTLLATSLRLCGLRDGTITPTFMNFARQQLLFSLYELTSRGTPLYTTKDITFGLGYNQSAYPLPSTIYNIQDVNWRTTQPTEYVPSGGAGVVDPQYLNDFSWFTYATTTNYFLASQPNVQLIGSIGLFFYGNQNVTISVEVSTDNVNWLNVYQDLNQTAYLDGTSLWVDLDPQFLGYYTRVSCGAGEGLALRQLYVTNLTSMTEIPMARMNKDTYFAYVNKRVQGSPLSWYYDILLNPILYIWNVPVELYNWQLRIKTKNLIKTNLGLGSELEIPVWYQEAITYMTAAKTIWILPRDVIKIDDAVALKAQAESMLKIANYSQTDMAPVTAWTNYRCYTI